VRLMTKKKKRRKRRVVRSGRKQKGCLPISYLQRRDESFLKEKASATYSDTSFHSYELVARALEQRDGSGEDDLDGWSRKRRR
jgi:hypothetical protein